MNGGRTVTGNTRTGRLFAIGGGQYLGERLVAGGRFETRRFTGGRKEARTAWEAWKAEASDGALIRCGRKPAAAPAAETREERPMAATEKKGEARPAQRYVYLLAYQQQRTTKGVAVFERMEDAIDMSDALTVALDATGMEGKYTVDELPVWGRRGDA